VGCGGGDEGRSGGGDRAAPERLAACAEDFNAYAVTTPSTDDNLTCWS